MNNESIQPEPVEATTFALADLNDIASQALLETVGFKSVLELVEAYKKAAVTEKIELSSGDASALRENLEMKRRITSLELQLHGANHALDQRRMHQRATIELRDHWAMLIYGKGGYDLKECYRRADQAMAVRTEIPYHPVPDEPK